MILLSCINLCKSYGINTILENITFNIQDGDKIGLVGVNGAGKSTLFKTIVGEIPKDSGDIYIDKYKAIGYMPQNMSLNSEDTIMDEMLKVFSDIINMEKRLRELEILISKKEHIADEKYHNKLLSEYADLLDKFNQSDGYGYKSFIRGVLVGLGFDDGDFDKKINILSGGQKTRIALGKLLLSKPDILLLDEPTNHLDLDAVEWLEDFLKQYKGSVFIISHDRFFLDVITNKTFEMDGKSLEQYNGNYSYFVKEKEVRRQNYLKQYALQQKEIARQEAVIERFRSYNREKSIKQAESREKALDRIERIEKPDNEPIAAKIKFETRSRSGNDVLKVENLSKSFDNKLLFDNIDFEIKRGEKVAIIGPNGTGKTTLFRIIMGLLSQDGGEVLLGRNVNIGYYDQEQSYLDPNKTVIDEVWDSYPDLTQTKLRTILGAFLFSGEDVFKKINLLSGGEKSRVALVKLILSKSNFLLLDEPTNNLDILSKEALENALMNYDGTILTISHDRYFLNRVATKIIYFSGIDGMAEYSGNYSYYLEKKGRPTRFIEEPKAYTTITKTAAKEEKRKLKEQQKIELQKKEAIKSLEEDIEDIEKEIMDLNELLCLEDVYSNPEKSQKVHDQLKELDTKLNQLYDEWEQKL